MKKNYESSERAEASGKTIEQEPGARARRLWERTKAARSAGQNYDNPLGVTQTLGWQPKCSCGGDPVPCTVFDPFMGAGTVGLVAQRLGLRWLGIELNPKYVEMANRRIVQEAPLLAGVE